MKCKPGDVCIIVAEVPGCEMNIGAQLTVTRLMPFTDIVAWEFADASRPLKMVPECGGGPEYWTRSTAEGLPKGRYGGFLDHHLLPVPGTRKVGDAAMAAPLELASA